MTSIFAEEYFTERTKFFAFGSMLANLGLGFVKIIIAIAQLSLYFAFNGSYNMVLGSCKLYALKKYKKASMALNADDKKHLETNCVKKMSVFVLCASIIYLIMGVFNLRRVDNAQYGISMVCFIAASAFFKLIFNTAGWVKTRGSGDKIILHIKLMNIADGCVAIAMTQRAILISEGSINAYFYSGLGEIVFSAIALCIAIAMLILAYSIKKNNN